MNTLELYVRDECPFCHKVLEVAEGMHITFTEHNIGDPAVAAELIARGGKQQVPYLVDTETGIEMYESDDIIEYLKDKQADEA